mmetsp:Transcript_3844/g.11164  ORF Transcript_3844/g.11164 Transcript_3844/m.11164 type:complete len:222 (+) Transcript_3844:1031-1696(+)
MLPLSSCTKLCNFRLFSHSTVYLSIHSLLAPSTIACNSGSFACKVWSSSCGSSFRMLWVTSFRKALTWALLAANVLLRPSNNAGGSMMPPGLLLAAAMASFFSCSIFLYATANCLSFFAVSFAFSSDASNSFRSTATSSPLVEAAGDGASVEAVAAGEAAAPTAAPSNFAAGGPPPEGVASAALSDGGGSRSRASAIDSTVAGGDDGRILRGCVGELAHQE